MLQGGWVLRDLGNHSRSRLEAYIVNDFRGRELLKGLQSPIISSNFSYHLQRLTNLFKVTARYSKVHKIKSKLRQREEPLITQEVFRSRSIKKIPRPLLS